VILDFIVARKRPGNSTLFRLMTIERLVEVAQATNARERFAADDFHRSQIRNFGAANRAGSLVAFLYPIILSSVSVSLCDDAQSSAI